MKQLEQFIQFNNLLTTTEWLMMSVALMLILSLISFKRQRLQQKQQQFHMQLLQRDLRALANAAVGVGERVIEIERQQRSRPVAVTESKQIRQAPISTTTIAPVEFYSPSNQPYEQAIRMVQSGANADDVVNVCGLSKSEAELVSMMHRLDQAS